ncbi:hypothetical protein [Lacticaseibacillus saniviri]|uniref:hypothetical protein n=1 Tax=Lacticaseibacillus saniviri TaxID=931533 RepID=UPI000B12290A|nr:hypothetical protein [Lacticaseibacillus saniviri]
MRWLKQQERTPEANVIASFYQQRHNRFVANDDLNAEENSLYVMAFQYEYQYVDTQLRAKQLSTEVANALREQISYDEMVYMQQQISFIQKGRGGRIGDDCRYCSKSGCEQRNRITGAELRSDALSD